MQTVKTSDLNGLALRYAAGLADGFDQEWLVRNPDAIPQYLSGHHFLRVIREYGIDVFKRLDGTQGWSASSVTADNYLFCEHGDDPAVAVMRCLVSMKLGSEVEIPKQFM